jgi:hypothetical protein
MFSGASDSLVPSPGTLGYFLISPAMVTFPSPWSTWPFTVWLHEASCSTPPPFTHVLHDLVKPVEGGDGQLEQCLPEGYKHPYSTPLVRWPHAMTSWNPPQAISSKNAKNKKGQLLLERMTCQILIESCLLYIATFVHESTLGDCDSIIIVNVYSYAFYVGFLGLVFTQYQRLNYL